MLDLIKELADGPPERGLDGHARGLPAVHGRAVVQLREHAAQLLRRAVQQRSCQLLSQGRHANV